MAVIPVRSLTCTGVQLSVVVPLPSSPSGLWPQAQTVHVPVHVEDGGVWSEPEPGPTTMVTEPSVVRSARSVAAMPKVYVPAVVGVPATMPVLARDKPGGRLAGVLVDQV